MRISKKHFMFSTFFGIIYGAVCFRYGETSIEPVYGPAITWGLIPALVCVLWGVGVFLLSSREKVNRTLNGILAAILSYFLCWWPLYLFYILDIFTINK